MNFYRIFQTLGHFATTRIQSTLLWQGAEGFRTLHDLKAFPVVLFISLCLSFSAFGQKPDEEHLNWRKRPAVVQEVINHKFDALKQHPISSWNIYNGDASYGLLSIDETRLVRQLIHDAQRQGRQDIYILDVGAGNFQLCDALASMLQTSGEIPPHMQVHIIGIRGETFTGKELTKVGSSTVYKFGGFKIENLEDEFIQRKMNLKGNVDFVISRWSMRHLVDPLGTWVQLYNILSPMTGLMIMDWFYYCQGD